MVPVSRQKQPESARRVAERTRNRYQVADGGGAAVQRRSSDGRRVADHRDGDEQGGRAHDVAAHYLAPVDVAGVEHPLVQIGHRLHVEVWVEPQAYDGEPWLAAHGRNVAQVDREGLPANLSPGGQVRPEVDALDHRVRSQHPRSRAAPPYGGVVAHRADECEPVLFAPFRSRAGPLRDGPRDHVDGAGLAYIRKAHDGVNYMGSGPSPSTFAGPTQRVQCSGLGLPASTGAASEGWLNTTTIWWS